MKGLDPLVSRLVEGHETLAGHDMAPSMAESFNQDHTMGIGQIRRHIGDANLAGNK